MGAFTQHWNHLWKDRGETSTFMVVCDKKHALARAIQVKQGRSIKISQGVKSCASMGRLSHVPLSFYLRLSSGGQCFAFVSGAFARVYWAETKVPT
jgi:hypothetical protein